MTTTYPTRTEKLQTAHAARVQEVENYQINIDNYTLAIERIDGMPDDERESHAEFRQKLVETLEAEKREQSKAKIMLSVLESQLET